MSDPRTLPGYQNGWEAGIGAGSALTHEWLDPMVMLAIRHAAHVMENVDPDDRSDSEAAIVEATKEWMRRANEGDNDVGALLLEAVPAWGVRHGP